VGGPISIKISQTLNDLEIWVRGGAIRKLGLFAFLSCIVCVQNRCDRHPASCDSVLLPVMCALVVGVFTIVIVILAAVVFVVISLYLRNDTI